jgi:hypothetical protein
MKIRTDNCRRAHRKTVGELKGGDLFATPIAAGPKTNYYIRTIHNSSQSREIDGVNAETGMRRSFPKDTCVTVPQCEVVIYEEKP